MFTSTNTRASLGNRLVSSCDEMTPKTKGPKPPRPKLLATIFHDLALAPPHWASHRQSLGHCRQRWRGQRVMQVWRARLLPRQHRNLASPREVVKHHHIGVLDGTARGM